MRNIDILLLNAGKCQQLSEWINHYVHWIKLSTPINLLIHVVRSKYNSIPVHLCKALDSDSTIPLEVISIFLQYNSGVFLLTDPLCMTLQQVPCFSPGKCMFLKTLLLLAPYLCLSYLCLSYLCLSYLYLIFVYLSHLC